MGRRYQPLETKFSGYGKDLVRFRTDVQNRVDKCQWTQIITFGTRNIITNYGEILKADVQAARNARNAAVITTLAQARTKIDALMMFHFLYDSLGPVPQKKLSTMLVSTNQDGPLLLKMILDDTYVATQASTFSIKEKFYDLNLKKYRFNVHSLNQDVREKLVDLVAAGHVSDQTDIIISLFRAYHTSTNEEFKSSVAYWKNEWNSSVWSTPDELMRRADAKYIELKDLGTWGKRSAKDNQIVALTSKIDALSKNNKDSKTRESNKDTDKNKESKVPKWKYDKSLSTNNSYKRNDKIYKWCTGPGHGSIGMWVVHEPGSCTKSKPGTKPGDTTTNQGPGTKLDKTALTAALNANGDLSADEVESKVEAIMAVIGS